MISFLPKNQVSVLPRYINSSVILFLRLKYSVLYLRHKIYVSPIILSKFGLTIFTTMGLVEGIRSIPLSFLKLRIPSVTQIKHWRTLYLWMFMRSSVYPLLLACAFWFFSTITLFTTNLSNVEVNYLYNCLF